MDAETLANLLREAKDRHSEYEPNAPEHDWVVWYAGYICARDEGMTPDEAVRHATAHTEGRPA
jgi:hypothetical protein